MWFGIILTAVLIACVTTILFFFFEFNPKIAPRDYKIVSKFEGHRVNWYIYARNRIWVWRHLWFPDDLKRRYDSEQDATRSLKTWLDFKLKREKIRKTVRKFKLIAAQDSPEFNPLSLLKKDVDEQEPSMPTDSIVLETGAQLVKQ